MKINYSLGILLATTSLICNAQIKDVKRNILELFFEVDLNPSKFDVRKKIHGEENFYEYGGIDYGTYETITASFKGNYKLSYLGRDEKQIVFWFDRGSEISYSRKISTEYFPEEFDKCDKEFQEIYSIFSKCSFKSIKTSIININNEKSGEGWKFYSSQKSLQDKKPYLVLSYWYFKINTVTIKPEGYIFEIILKDQDVF